MEDILVYTANSEQSRVLKAFLEALKITYQTKTPTREEMEARLMPKEREVWEGLKQALYEVKNGTAIGTSMDDFLNELR